MGAPESGTLIIRELSFPLLHFIVIKTSNDSIGWRVIPISTLEKLGEKWFSNVISLIFIQNTPQTIPPTYPQLERALSLWPLLLRFLKQYNKPKQHVSPTPPPHSWFPISCENLCVPTPSVKISCQPLSPSIHKLSSHLTWRDAPN